MAAKKRASWIVCGILLATLIAAGFVIRLAAPETESGAFAQLGKIETEQSQNNSAVYTGDHITILADDLERYTKRAQLITGSEDVSEQALHNLAVREIFCYRAEEAGIPDDDDQFAQWLAEYRKGIENAVNYSDFEAFTQGAGMTEEEYWDWAGTSESFRKEYYSTLFVKKLKEDFRAVCELTPGGEEYQEAWNSYFDEYKKQAVEDEHLKKATDGKTE
ncbi:hypothetical protein [uncultured Neglectibacter sp.]|uniref:hypothetical protein n=1 Tax=uncultured Neglectibacter sp. TaxID=1924108 RepID=UPI0034DDF4C2